MSAFSHQDWNTVVLRPKKPEQTKTTVTKSSIAPVSISSATGKPAWKVEAQVDSETGKPVEYVPKDVAAAIVNGRVAMKLSQKDLAARVNMQLRDIQEIESGKALYNKAKIAKLKQFLRI